MVYGAVLAGGIGSRMNLGDMPKQFLMLGDKPIIIHTLEKFIYSASIEIVYTAVNKDWMAYFEDLLVKYSVPRDRLRVVCGGRDRNESIMNVIDDIDSRDGIDSCSVIVTHDAVRPFVTARIIDENVRAAQQYGMCDTAIAATDTIAVSRDGEVIDEIPRREFIYQGQTPQSFNIKMLRELYTSLENDEKKILTDACKICTLKGKKVHIVPGEVYNMKITTVSDYKIAKAVLGGDFD